MMSADRRRRPSAVLAALCAVSLAVMAVTAQTVVTPPKNKYTPEQDVQLGKEAAADFARRVGLVHREWTHFELEPFRCDRIEHHGLATLFAKQRDAIEVIKWKDIYSDLETATDRCEDVANVIGFLAGSKAAYMTGQAISVDGGLVMM